VQQASRPRAFHAAHHIENTIEGGPVFYLAPRGAHAESRGTGRARPRCGVETSSSASIFSPETGVS